MEENCFSSAVKENKFLNSIHEQNTVQCNYYDSQEFVSLRLNQPNYLNIFFLNISSLPKHGGELVCFLNSLETTFHVIVLNEIGRLNLPSMQNLIEGYTFFFEPPDSNAKGGVGIYINNCLMNVVRKPDIEFKKTCGCAICEIESMCINFDFYNQQFTLLSVYRHPRGNKCHFTEDLEKSLNKIQKSRTALIIGDTNIDLLMFGQKDAHANFASSLFSNGYMPYITYPTRITSHSATLIDQIFAKTPKNNFDINSGILFSDISDHLPCYISLKCKTKTEKCKNDRPKVRLYGDKQCKEFVVKMASFPWNSLYAQDVDWYHEFIVAVYNIFCASFPMVTLSRKRMKDKPWMTKELKKACILNSKLYKKSIKSSDPSAVERYRSYNKIYKYNLQRTEMEYYREIFGSNTTSIKELWKHLGTLINQKNKKARTRIDKLYYKGKSHTKDIDIANAMNDHFCSVGETLQNKLPTCNENAFKEYLPNPVMNSFVLSHILYEDILREINQLNIKKAAGQDGLGPKIVKLCPEIFAVNLIKIFNKSIDDGVYPSEMKLARVIALFKKGSKQDPDNYRPISLLPICNKIFERLICIQLKSFLEKYKIYVDFQFGFRPDHSTVMALTEMTDSVRCLLDSGYYVLGLFVDLSKAFDTVDHDILLYKLSQYGIRGHSNNFFRSYLSNRSQYTTINDTNSSKKNITCGVPQGSVLGPVLFLLYVNDLSQAIRHGTARLFADDTNIFTYDKKIDDLIARSIDVYKCLFKWCISNRLTINFSKTCFMLFTTKNKYVPPNFNVIKVDDIIIHRSDVTKYLGLYIDEKLTWKFHVNELCKKLVQYFGIFKRVKDKVTQKLVRQLYFAFIYSRISYGIQVYGSCSNKLLNKVQTLQNGLLKYFLNLKHRYHTNNLHIKLQILKVKDIYEVNILAFVRKCLLHECPDLFHDYYSYQNHRFQATGQKLLVPRTRIVLGSLSLKIQGASLWNNLNMIIKDKMKFKSFKKIITKYYIGRYPWEVNTIQQL